MVDDGGFRTGAAVISLREARLAKNAKRLEREQQKAQQHKLAQASMLSHHQQHGSWIHRLEDCPVFSPTLAEFADPMAYIRRIQPDAAKFGVCKIIPPYQPGVPPGQVLNDNAPDRRQFTFQARVQELKTIRWTSWSSGDFYIKPRRYSLQEYQAMASAYATKKYGSIGHMPPFHAEVEYWRQREMESAGNGSGGGGGSGSSSTVEYANDVVGTAFARPETGDPLGATDWNLNVLPELPETLLPYIQYPIPGVTSPMLYIGMLHATFAWHIEDHYLYSINYHHMGAPKTWYGIPGSDADAFERVVLEEVYDQVLADERRAGIPEPRRRDRGLASLLNKTTVVHPKLLMDKGVHVYRAVQHAGEFVVTFPRAYHAGFSHGFNCGEAVNFGMHEWLPYAAAADLRLARLRRRILLPTDSVTCCAAMEVLEQLAPPLTPALAPAAADAGAAGAEAAEGSPARAGLARGGGGSDLAVGAAEEPGKETALHVRSSRQQQTGRASGGGQVGAVAPTRGSSPYPSRSGGRQQQQTAPQAEAEESEAEADEDVTAAEEDGAPQRAFRSCQMVEVSERQMEPLQAALAAALEEGRAGRPPPHLSALISLWRLVRRHVTHVDVLLRRGAALSEMHSEAEDTVCSLCETSCFLGYASSPAFKGEQDSEAAMCRCVACAASATRTQHPEQQQQVPQASPPPAAATDGAAASCADEVLVCVSNRLRTFVPWVQILDGCLCAYDGPETMLDCTGSGTQEAQLYGEVSGLQPAEYGWGRPFEWANFMDAWLGVIAPGVHARAVLSPLSTAAAPKAISSTGGMAAAAAAAAAASTSTSSHGRCADGERCAGSGSMDTGRAAEGACGGLSEAATTCGRFTENTAAEAPGMEAGGRPDDNTETADPAEISTRAVAAAPQCTTTADAGGAGAPGACSASATCRASVSGAGDAADGGASDGGDGGSEPGIERSSSSHDSVPLAVLAARVFAASRRRGKGIPGAGGLRCLPLARNRKQTEAATAVAAAAAVPRSRLARPVLAMEPNPGAPYAAQGARQKKTPGASSAGEAVAVAADAAPSAATGRDTDSATRTASGAGPNAAAAAASMPEGTAAAATAPDVFAPVELPPPPLRQAGGPLSGKRSRLSAGTRSSPAAAAAIRALGAGSGCGIPSRLGAGLAAMAAGQGQGQRNVKYRSLQELARMLPTMPPRRRAPMAHAIAADASMAAAAAASANLHGVQASPDTLAVRAVRPVDYVAAGAPSGDAQSPGCSGSGAAAAFAMGHQQGIPWQCSVDSRLGGQGLEEPSDAAYLADFGAGLLEGCGPSDAAAGDLDMDFNVCGLGAEADAFITATAAAVAVGGDDGLVQSGCGRGPTHMSLAPVACWQQQQEEHHHLMSQQAPQQLSEWRQQWQRPEQVEWQQPMQQSWQQQQHHYQQLQLQQQMEQHQQQYQELQQHQLQHQHPQQHDQQQQQQVQQMQQMQQHHQLQLQQHQERQQQDWWLQSQQPHQPDGFVEGGTHHGPGQASTSCPQAQQPPGQAHWPAHPNPNPNPNPHPQPAALQAPEDLLRSMLANHSGLLLQRLWETHQLHAPGATAAATAGPVITVATMPLAAAAAASHVDLPHGPQGQQLRYSRHVLVTHGEGAGPVDCRPAWDGWCVLRADEVVRALARLTPSWDPQLAAAGAASTSSQFEALCVALWRWLRMPGRLLRGQPADAQLIIGGAAHQNAALWTRLPWPHVVLSVEQLAQMSQALSAAQQGQLADDLRWLYHDLPGGRHGCALEPSPASHRPLAAPRMDPAPLEDPHAAWIQQPGSGPTGQLAPTRSPYKAQCQVPPRPSGEAAPSEALVQPRCYARYSFDNMSAGGSQQGPASASAATAPFSAAPQVGGLPESPFATCAKVGLTAIGSAEPHRLHAQPQHHVLLQQLQQPQPVGQASASQAPPAWGPPLMLPDSRLSLPAPPTASAAGAASAVGQDGQESPPPPPPASPPQRPEAPFSRVASLPAAEALQPAAPHQALLLRPTVSLPRAAMTQLEAVTSTFPAPQRLSCGAAPDCSGGASVPNGRELLIPCALAPGAVPAPREPLGSPSGPLITGPPRQGAGPETAPEGASPSDDSLTQPQPQPQEVGGYGCSQPPDGLPRRISSGETSLSGRSGGIGDSGSGASPDLAVPVAVGALTPPPPPHIISPTSAPEPLPTLPSSRCTSGATAPCAPPSDLRVAGSQQQEPPDSTPVAAEQPLHAPDRPLALSPATEAPGLERCKPESSGNSGSEGRSGLGPMDPYEGLRGAQQEGSGLVLEGRVGVQVSPCPDGTGGDRLPSGRLAPRCDVYVHPPDDRGGTVAMWRAGDGACSGRPDGERELLQPAAGQGTWQQQQPRQPQQQQGEQEEGHQGCQVALPFDGLAQAQQQWQRLPLQLPAAQLQLQQQHQRAVPTLLPPPPQQQQHHTHQQHQQPRSLQRPHETPYISQSEVDLQGHVVNPAFPRQSQSQQLHLGQQPAQQHPQYQQNQEHPKQYQQHCQHYHQLSQQQHHQRQLGYQQQHQHKTPVEPQRLPLSQGLTATTASRPSWLCPQGPSASEASTLMAAGPCAPLTAVATTTASASIARGMRPDMAAPTLSWPVQGIAGNLATAEPGATVTASACPAGASTGPALNGAGLQVSAPSGALKAAVLERNQAVVAQLFHGRGANTPSSTAPWSKWLGVPGGEGGQAQAQPLLASADNRGSVLVAAAAGGLGLEPVWVKAEGAHASGEVRSGTAGGGPGAGEGTAFPRAPKRIRADGLSDPPPDCGWLAAGIADRAAGSMITSSVGQAAATPALELQPSVRWSSAGDEERLAARTAGFTADVGGQQIGGAPYRGLHGGTWPTQQQCLKAPLPDLPAQLPSGAHVQPPQVTFFQS